MSATAIDTITFLFMMLCGFGGVVLLEDLNDYIHRLREYPSFLQARGKSLNEEYHKVKDWGFQFKRLKSDIITFRENFTDIDAHLQRTGNQPSCVKSSPNHAHAVAERNALIDRLENILIEFNRRAGGVTHTEIGLRQHLEELNSSTQQ